MIEQEALEFIERLKTLRQLAEDLGAMPKEKLKQEELDVQQKKFDVLQKGMADLLQSLVKMGQQSIWRGNTEYFPVVFKAIVDKTGRITIPLPERQAEQIESGMVVQVKIRVLREPKK